MDIENRIHSFKRFNNEPGLGRMKKLLELLGNPQNRMKFIHVAGTNGKGSTSRYIYEILSENGYKVGLYTSPYLLKFNERIEFDHKLIEDSELEKYFEMVNSASNQLPLSGFTLPTEFEIITAIAFLFFKEKDCDFVVLETGLGGRLDATNVINKPLCSVITSISFDHMEVLGDTISKIATEKAGIIKKECPVITSATQADAIKVIEETAFKKNSEAYFTYRMKYKINSITLDGCNFDVTINGYEYRHIEISMPGLHQIENAILAIGAINILENMGKAKIDHKKMLIGLKKAKQIGRFEIIKKDPLTIIDGAHNPDAARRLKEAINTLLPNKKILVVIGMLKDKDVLGVLNELKDLTDTFIVSGVDNPRGISPKELADILESEEFDKMTYISEKASDAAATALTVGKRYDAIVFCGSIYFIGEIATYLS